MTDPLLEVDGDFTLRYLSPASKKNIRRIMLLLHGWTGDENTMWIFMRQPPPDTLIVSPRGFVPANPSGYGWFLSAEKLDTPLKVYLPAARKLLKLLDQWLNKFGMPDLLLNVIGFSQGAAMAGVLGTFFPQRVDRTAMLAGFLPPEIGSAVEQSNLQSKRIYIAHGSRDEIVPFSRAEETAAMLTSIGMNVTFCASDAGHKLSLECARGLQEFLND